MSADTAFRQLRNANPVPDPAALCERRQDAAAFFATTQQRSRGMQTQDKPINVGQLEPPRPPRRRWLVPALAGAATVIMAVVVAIALLADDDEPDVTNQAPVPTTVVSGQEGALADDDEPDGINEGPVPTTVVLGREGAASLIGISGRVTGGVASSRPDVIHFDEDGTFRVELNGDTIDNGAYQTEGDLISFISEPSLPVWQHDPLMGPGDPSASIGSNFPCDGLAGEYRVVFEGATFTFEAVWDECRPRLAVAKGLQMEALTG